MKTDPKFIEQLVEIITREVLVAMAEEEARADNPEGYQCKFDCTDQLCVRLCYDRMGNVVNAGAERLTSTLGVIPPEQNLAKMIDHTLLKPDATQQEIAQLCFEAEETWFRFCVCEPHLGESVCPVTAGLAGEGLYRDRLSPGSNLLRDQGL